MKHSCHWLSASLILTCTILMTSGCSETTKEAKPLPDVIFPVYHPYIENGQVYSIEKEVEYGVSPKAGQSNELTRKLLFTVDSGLLLALDTDETVKSSENAVELFEHTHMPEYIAYAKKHTLHVYDLDTRYDHEVFSFETDQFNPEATPGFICDLQKVITWDEETRLSKKVLFKDELAVYVKTSANEDCSEPEDGFKFWQINITSSEETFKVRRRYLKEHTHEHKHFHDHDNEDDELFAEHDHKHTLEEGELDSDGLPFDPKNHKHKHTHSHQFVYGPEHAHEHLTQDEIDVIHNDKRFHEIRFETGFKLVGRKTTIESIDEALMYSGTPVIDIPQRNFGYLGLNSKENSLKFYSVNLETLTKKLLWTLAHDDFANLTNQPNPITDWKALVSYYNRPVNYQIINSNIAYFTPNKLYYFKLVDLFDDDREEERLESINQPFFSGSSQPLALDQRSRYNPVSNMLAIVENTQVWLAKLSADTKTPSRIKTFSEAGLTSLQAQVLGTELMVTKHFEVDGQASSSIITLQENGLETNTVLNRTNDALTVIPQDNASLLNLTSDDTSNLSARYILNNFGSPFSPLIESLWVKNSLDYRGDFESKIVSQLSSDSLTQVAGTVEMPTLYLLDDEETAGRGEQFLTVEDAVKSADHFVIFNEFYTILEYLNGDETTTVIPTIEEY